MDEAAIQATLDNSTRLSPSGLRGLMVLVLLACYDRRVTRKFFVEMLEDVQSMYIMIDRLEAGVYVGNVLCDHTPAETTGKKPEKLVTELAKITAKIGDLRVKMHEKMGLLMECPTSDDKIY
jgi:hypothetical protein